MIPIKPIHPVNPIIRLYATALCCTAMLAAIPFAEIMAVTASAPIYTHFIYMFAHANIFHWLVNSWSLLVLHNAFRWYRCAAAYIIASAVSFVPFLVAAKPTVGASVFTCFFLGYIAPHFWATRQRSVVLITASVLALGLFLPGIAAALHITLYLAGIIFYYIERTIRSIHAYITQ